MKSDISFSLEADRADPLESRISISPFPTYAFFTSSHYFVIQEVAPRRVTTETRGSSRKRGFAMDNDDLPVGRILRRREVLALIGSAGGVAAAVGALQPRAVAQTSSAAALPSCIVKPELTEGPYFVDEKLLRSDIRSDPTTKAISAGVPLRLTFLVSKVSSAGCAALQNAAVDIWHCDASGLYSDESANNTVGKKFLRGYQVTDKNGKAQFLTIYPGWYPGRAVHIHFKVRGKDSTSKSYEFTSQLFFDDALSDTVFKNAAYGNRGTRNVRNANDGIYRNGGSQLLLKLEKDGTGYAATFDMGLQVA
jgi:protocatechuate 3,4-dioxygenase beta subunit